MYTMKGVVTLNRKSPMKSMPVSSRVVHEKYGLGVITEVDPQYTTINFDDHGKKKFVTEIVSLKASDEPPPKRRRGGRKPKPS
jgi:hypothetical protein